jgi:hypothetical protein
MDHFIIGDLTARLDRPGPGVLGVRFTGRSAARDARVALAPLFDRTVEAARDERRTVALHFEALEYFNSSTIAALVQFIRTAQEAGLGLEIVYDGRQRWQAMSFDALRRALRSTAEGTGGPAVTFRES